MVLLKKKKKKENEKPILLAPFSIFVQHAQLILPATPSMPGKPCYLKIQVNDYVQFIRFIKNVPSKLTNEKLNKPTATKKCYLYTRANMKITI